MAKICLTVYCDDCSERECFVGNPRFLVGDNVMVGLQSSMIRIRVARDCLFCEKLHLATCDVLRRWSVVGAG